MKRDLDLIRTILMALEDAPTGWAPELKLNGYTDAQVGYHAYLVMDAGLARGSDVTTAGSEGPEALLSSLTWEGHEFVEAARDESRWQRAKGMVAEKGGGISLDVLKALLISLAKSALGLP